MGIREKINSNPKVGGAVAAGVAVVAVGILVVQFAGGSADRERVTNRFFTADDGKTFYQDTIDNVPPFQKDGAEVAWVELYDCGQGPVVGYLMRPTEAGRKDILAKQEQYGWEHASVLQTSPDQTMVKKPGESKWVALNSPAAGAVMDFRCPDGGVPQRVEP